MLKRLLRIITAVLLAFVALLVIAAVGMIPTMRRLSSTHHGNPFVKINKSGVIPKDVRIVRDIEFEKVGSSSLRLDILRPKSMPSHPIPAVIWIHGGWFHKGNRNIFYSPLFKLISSGFAIVSIDYRLTQDAPFPAQVQDCKCAVRWLRAHSKEYGIDPHRIGACGGSAGGYLAAFLGASAGIKAFEGDGGCKDQPSDVQAVADYYGPTDFRAIPKEISSNRISLVLANLIANNRLSPISQFLGCSMAASPEKCKAASPISYVKKGIPPFLILHGKKDMTVPFNQSELLYHALKKAGIEAELVAVPNGAHEFSDTRADARMIEFFTKHLKERP
jgi:acetyl esterase/lipase